MESMLRFSVGLSVTVKLRSRSCNGTLLIQLIRLSYVSVTLSVKEFMSMSVRDLCQ